MASIFKRSKRKNTPWTIQYFDHLGKRRTKKGFTDKGLTEELAAKLEGEARLRVTGLIDAEQERYAAHKLAPISESLTAFEESLAENSLKHIKQVKTQVWRIVNGAGFARLADIEPEAVQTFLRSLRKEEDGIGPRTYNLYLEAMDSFLNWCVTAKRLLTNPLAGLERLNTAVDVRRKRRALTADELGKLVASARASGLRIQKFTGEERARIYILSYMTGLRRKELASLTPRSFQLDAVPPTLTVEAKFSKHRRKDILPLHPELVVLLRDWLRKVLPAEHLFPMLAGRKTGKMVRLDLERAGIAYENDQGVADFHAAGRHSHITELLRNGTTLPEAKELARHSDIKMTMRYTHIGIEDQAQAVAKLPVPRIKTQVDAKETPVREAALHGRCISGGAERPSLALGDTKRGNGIGAKFVAATGFDRNSRPVSQAGNSEAAGLIPAGVRLLSHATGWPGRVCSTGWIAKRQESTPFGTVRRSRVDTTTVLHGEDRYSDDTREWTRLL